MDVSLMSSEVMTKSSPAGNAIPVVHSVNKSLTLRNHKFRFNKKRMRTHKTVTITHGVSRLRLMAVQAQS